MEPIHARSFNKISTSHFPIKFSYKIAIWQQRRAITSESLSYHWLPSLFTKIDFFHFSRKFFGKVLTRAPRVGILQAADGQGEAEGQGQSRKNPTAWWSPKQLAAAAADRHSSNPWNTITVHNHCHFFRIDANAPSDYTMDHTWVSTSFATTCHTIHSVSFCVQSFRTTDKISDAILVHVLGRENFTSKTVLWFEISLVKHAREFRGHFWT